MSTEQMRQVRRQNRRTSASTEQDKCVEGTNETSALTEQDKCVDVTNETSALTE